MQKNVSLLQGTSSRVEQHDYRKVRSLLPKMYPNFQVRGARVCNSVRSYLGASLVGASSQAALNSNLSRGYGKPEKISFTARYEKQRHMLLPPAVSRIVRATSPIHFSHK